MKYEIIRLIDILGTVTFAISGVSAAMKKKLDVFGILIIAFITSVGGGTVRDLMTGDLPVTWIRNIDYSIIILLATTAGILFNNYIKQLGTTLLVFDSLGLGFFTVLGVQKGIALGLDPLICVILGTITGCFGGVIRDISLNNIPMIFEKEIYATVCLVGGGAYFGLIRVGLGEDWVTTITISLIFLIRLVVVKFKLSLPDIYAHVKQGEQSRL